LIRGVLELNLMPFGSPSFLVTGRWVVCLPPLGTGGG
jgi:hypothetical protein